MVIPLLPWWTAAWIRAYREFRGNGASEQSATVLATKAVGVMTRIALTQQKGSGDGR